MAYPVNDVRTTIAGIPVQGTATPGSHRQKMNPDGTKATSPVIFFDNDENKITQISGKCNDIELVRVPESDVEATNKTALNPAYAPLWAGHDINTNAYTRIHTPNNPVPHQHFDIHSGMQIPEFTIINNWVARSAGQRAAIFDWDRTLTMVEGLVLPHPTPAANTIRDVISLFPPFAAEGGAPANYVEDMLIYLCGGPIRLAILRDMFTYLRTNNIDIAIITNNRAAGDDRRDLFKELVKALINVPGYEPEIRCSYYAIPSGNKGTVMKDMHPALCSGPMAGGRRRRTKNRLQRRKTTRRRRT